MPAIAVINASTVIGDAEIRGYLPAFEQQWNRDLQPIWSTDRASFSFVPKGQAPAAGAWWLVFLDNSDQARNLAYHDLTNEGLPVSKVFVKTLQADKASVSVGASHELCEMAVDPWLNSAYQDTNGKFWAGEICDPVQHDQYGYKIGQVLVTDFVTPAWFGHKYAQGAIDLQGHVKAPFEVLEAGYAQVFHHKDGWRQLNGSDAVSGEHALRPSSGSRRLRRSRRLGSQRGALALTTLRPSVRGPGGPSARPARAAAGPRR